MSIDEIHEVLKSVNINKISADQVKRLHSLLPLDEEIELITMYERTQKQNLSELGVAEKFFKVISEIPKYQLRYDVLLCMSTFQSTVTSLEEDINTVISACQFIKSSTGLQDVLSIVLAFGNYMNQSSATGFKLSTLQRLQHTKSSDNKST